MWPASMLNSSFCQNINMNQLTKPHGLVASRPAQSRSLRLYLQGGTASPHACISSAGRSKQLARRCRAKSVKHGSCCPSALYGACSISSRQGSCNAGRDPERVSLLSADELPDNPPGAAAIQQPASSASSTRHDLHSNTTHQGSSNSSAATSHCSADHASPHLAQCKFSVSATELRSVVAAGADASQSAAAEEIISAVIARVVGKHSAKHTRRTAKRAHSGSNGHGALVSNGSTAAVAEQNMTTPSISAALATALHTDLRHGVHGDAADTAARVSAFGSNSLAVSTTSSFWQLLLEAASDSTLLLLMAAGAVSLGLTAVTGKEAVDYIDGAAILASVAICVNVTAVTNYQKESKFRQLNSLKENVSVRVVRGGSEVTVSCFDLLVGDVLLVECGDILPADGLLVQGDYIKVDESHLTGESDDVDKQAVSSSSSGSESINLSSCICMSGSKVLEGFGRLLVLAVGPNSQQGMIQQLVMRGGTAPADGSAPGTTDAGDVPMLREATPLTSRLEDLANSIGGVGLAAAAAVLAVNAGLYTFEMVSGGVSVFTGDSLEAYLGFFITSMTLLVVAVPEGLPLAVTLALAFSVQRMLTDNNLVRNLSSCETMAAATSICSDKTGTLTENNMAVVKLFMGSVMFNVRPSNSGNSSSSSTAAAGVASTESAMSSHHSISIRSTSSILGSTDATAGNSPESDEEQQNNQTHSSNSSSSGGSSAESSSSSASSAGSAASSTDHAGVSVGSTSSSRLPRPGPGVPSVGYDSVPNDVLTRVSLSWDERDQLEGVPLTPATYEEQYYMAMQQQQEQRQRQQQAVAAAGGNDVESLVGLADEPVLLACPLDDDSTLSISSTSSMFGAGPAGPPSCMSDNVKQLLADSISLNSTASIRLVPQQPQDAAQPSDGGNGADTGRQLDRSGNRTECALLEFGGRLSGRILPGAGSAQHTQQILQVFPFSSSRKRMSTLVTHGAAVATPGTGSAVQPARLYVKGAAEIVLDSCRLQVGLPGALLPLPPDQVTALKARCGKGGLRVLALAYKDILLHPAKQPQDSGSSSGNGSEWQLLSGDDDDQHDLVLIALLGLEDPVRAAVPYAISDCQRAGIAVRMITGDNAATAAAIAATCGILPHQLAAEVEQQAAQRSAAGLSDNEHISNLHKLLTDLPQPPVLASSGSSGDGDQKRGMMGRLTHDVWGRVGGADPAAGAALMNAVSPDPALAVLEGPQFRALVLKPDGSTDLDAFLALWPHLRVMARCTPADKYTLVQAVKALRARGILTETIAVTGDGTNDAPALNAADVGFAMAAGTSIAKDASDILLLDNNFRSIVSAVKWGRNVYGCVTKFLQFQLTANVVALVTAAGGALALRSSPLSAVQMLWVNLIMDSLASLALATEAPSDTALDEPPRARDGAIITPTVAKAILGQAALQLGVLAALLGPLGAAVMAVGGDAAAATGLDAADHTAQYTLVFNTFVIMQLFNQLNSRKIHDEPNILDGLGDQQLFLGILGLEAALQVIIVQAGGRAFSTVPLTPQQWAVCVGFGGLTLLLRQALRAIPTEPPGPGGGTAADSSSQSSGSVWKAKAFSAAVLSTPVNAVKRVMSVVVRGVRHAVTAGAGWGSGARTDLASNREVARPTTQPQRLKHQHMR